MLSSEKKRPSLGRGLSALLADAKPVHDGKAGVLQLAIESIRPDNRQPRRAFDDQAISELAQSIKTQGLLQPVLVRRQGQGYRLIAGERRWRAAQKAGLQEIPALVKEVSDADAFEMALVENLQREDLNPLEEADGYKRLLDDRRWTQEQVAERVGKERSTVANALRLLQLPTEVKGLLSAGDLDMGHARALLGLSKPAEMVALAKAVVAEKLSVRETEARVKAGKPSTKKRPAPRSSPEAKKLVEDLQRRLGTRVRLNERNGRGNLQIEFFSYEDLDRIVNLIRK